MTGFKAQVKRDIKSVFHNTKEHADKTRIRYNGKVYNIPVIFDHDGETDRKRPSSDNADGIFISDLTVFISQYDLKTMPRKETQIEIGDDLYNIVKVSCDAGEIKLSLEMLDE